MEENNAFESIFLYHVVGAIAQLLEASDAGSVVWRCGGAQQVISLSPRLGVQLFAQRHLQMVPAPVGVYEAYLEMGSLMPFCIDALQQWCQRFCVALLWHVQHG